VNRRRTRMNNLFASTAGRYAGRQAGRIIPERKNCTTIHIIPSSGTRSITAHALRLFYYRAQLSGGGCRLCVSVSCFPTAAVVQDVPTYTVIRHFGKFSDFRPDLEFTPRNGRVFCSFVSNRDRFRTLI